MADNTLIISFQNNRPLPVGELGKLLEDLASDYRRATDSELVLSNVVTGSTWLFLTDAITLFGSGAEAVSATVAAANNLASFTRKISDYLNSVKKRPTAVDVYQHPSPVMKSAERMAKISMEQEAAFGLKYNRNENGESLEFNYKPSESAEIVENIKLARVMRKEAETLSQRAIPAPKATYRIGRPAHDAQEARTFSVPELGADQSESAVLIWVNALKNNGLDWLLPTIASDFEAQGNYEVARIIRTQIPGDDKDMVRVTE
ncbi:hypothetical protein [Mesorhizobium captivum]|uniref:hypothetical protein n=1 Tax=Mesorhizobium captivum TaxID=3072319 RepID=UPI002A2411B6|nr:hypothetical protein [Mesorhizobium sp. VK23E]MDX8515089.1 hypothetical protein [Mesorhizobium sp. VK23E]